MHTQFIDRHHLPCSGILSVRATNRKGQELFSFNDQNMIMAATKETLAHLVGGDVENQSVTHVVLGNKATTPSPDNNSIGGISTGNLVPGQNLVNDTICAYLKSITSHSYPAPGRIQFSWELDYGEANGLVINEYGLINTGLTLFARKTRGTVTKDSGMHIAGNWTIIF